MPMLQIRLFGHLSLTYDDQPLVLTSARLQSLLAYLLLQRTAQPRAQLAYLLWADSSDAKARSSLRFLLHQLRRTLPSADRYLEITAHTVQWRPEAPFWLDVLEFERALAAVAAPGAHVRAALERACALYTDDLLTSCYDDWIFGERERLRQLFVAAQEQLVLCCEREGAYADAIRHAQRLLRYDPLHEEAYRRLMQLHALSGDRVGALRVYHTCVAILRRELDVEPGVATLAAYLKLLEPPAQTVETRSQPTASPPGGLPNNLPLRLTSFVGRAQAKTELARVLARTRLLTLSGVAGVGKTRLALELAAHLAEGSALSGGVWWVDLAALHQPEFVAQTVAAVLDVHEQAGQSSLEALVHFLRDRELLLALDNCEHLVDACAQLVDALLRHCPHVRVMATSREVLNLPAETTFVVAPLTLPAGTLEPVHDALYGSAAPMPALDAVVAQSEAVRLFVERATAALPTFQLTARNAAAVAQICRRLDGLPLAIELAAARVKLLSVEQLATRLDESLDLLTSGSRSALPRHRTLRAAIDWSYGLLAESERELFRRLSVFRGGFVLDAAEIVGGEGDTSILETLSHLVDKSLLAAETQRDGEARCGMLETIREYAREKLSAAGELDSLRWKHARYFAALAASAYIGLFGAQQLAWSTRLEQELGNLRAALEFLLASDASFDRVEMALQLTRDINRFWYARGHISEGRQWLERALALSRGHATPQRAAALQAAGWLARHQVDLTHAEARLQESAALFRSLADERGLSGTLDSLGDVALSAGNHRQAEQFYQESLALRRVQGDPEPIALSLNSVGDAACAQRDYARAASYYNESLALFREVGDRRGMALSTSGLGHVALAEASYALAAERLKQGLALFAELGNKLDIAICMEALAQVSTAQGEGPRALRLLAASETLRQSLGAPYTRADDARLSPLRQSLCLALGEPVCAALWAEGRALPLSQAVQYALAGGDSA